MVSQSSQRKRPAVRVNDELLHAAARAFARRGFDAATMQDIAREAGCAVATLYAHFHGKRDIIDALVGRLGEGVLGAFDEPAPAGLSFAQRLELVLYRQLAFGECWQDALMFVFANKPTTTGGRRSGGTLRLPRSDVFTDRLTEWIRANAQAEELGGRSPEDVAYILKGILQGVFHQWLRSGSKERLADRAPAIVQVLLHGVMGHGEAET